MWIENLIVNVKSVSRWSISLSFASVYKYPCNRIKVEESKLTKLHNLKCYTALRDEMMMVVWEDGDVGDCALG